MNSTPQKHGKRNLFRQARAAAMLRGMTIKEVADALNIHRNTFRLALRTDECPRARMKIIKFLSLAA